jgi:hypothetical protein
MSTTNVQDEATKAQAEAKRQEKLGLVGNDLTINPFDTVKRYNSFDESTLVNKSGLPPVDKEIFEDLTWFQDDFSNTGVRIAADANKQYYRYEYSFSITFFIEAFLLHFLQLFLLGPFVVVIGFFYFPYLRLMGNMSFFWGCPALPMSTIHWVVNLLILLSRFHWELSTIDNSVVILAFVVTFSRCVFIASKYATYSAMFRARNMSRLITSSERRRYVLGGPWGEQDPNFVEEMIEHCMRRKYIDNSTFKVNFIEKPSKEAQELLAADLSNGGQLNIDIGKTTKTTDINGESYTYYDAKIILFHLFSQYRQEFFPRHTLSIVGIPGLLFAIFFAMLPGFGRWDAGMSFCGWDPVEIVMFWVAYIVNALMLFASFFGFTVAYRDYDRIDYGLEQLTQMYSVTRRPEIKRKIFPTINLADAISLQSWLNMRKVVYDFGINFTSRHKFYITTCLAISVSCFVLSISQDILFTDLSPESIRVQSWVLIPLSALFGLKFVILMRKCQEINDNFESQMELIREAQSTFQTIHHFRDYYVKGNEDLELPFDVNEAFNTAPRSEAHKMIIEKLKALVGDNMKQLDEYAEKLVEMQNEFVVELEREDRFHAKTLFGFRVNFAIFGVSFFALVIGILYAYLNEFQN